MRRNGKEIPSISCITQYVCLAFTVGYHVGRGFTPLLRHPPSPSINRYLPSIAFCPAHDLHTSETVRCQVTHPNGVKPLQYAPDAIITLRMVFGFSVGYHVERDFTPFGCVPRHDRDHTGIARPSPAFRGIPMN